MSVWSNGGVLGSLRKRVARDIREHQRTNAALQSARYPVSVRCLRAFFGKRTLPGFVIPYVVIVALLLVLESVLSAFYPSFIPAWTASDSVKPLLKDVTGYFLGAQAVVIGLLFPIAVALVTLIVQREEASSTISEVQVYYNETLAYRIGASGLGLSIVLAVQLLWPGQFAIHLIGLGTSFQFFKVILTGFHAVWLVINLSALW